MPLYADLILPLPLDTLFTYQVPADMQHIVHEGVRAVVPFGKKKYYTGIVVRVYQSESREGIKPILTLLENHPIVLPQQLRFWEWIANYYMCTLGDVYKAALPSSLKLESKTYVFLNPDYEGEKQMTPSESKVYHQLQPTQALSIGEIERLTNIDNAVSAIKSLTDKGMARLSETIEDKYIAKKRTAVRLFKKFSDIELNDILNGLSRAQKQQDTFLAFLDMQTTNETVFRTELLSAANTSPNVLAELVKKQILEVYDIPISRFDYGAVNLDSAYALNLYQQKAYEEIKSSFEDKDVSLLFGVTSSGKTEIYIQLIKDMISQGKQVLYLLPEIALTTQIMKRLKGVFGEKLAVYHSKFSDNERVDIWNSLLKGNEYQVVLGARSAVFLPFVDLGLVIVDEEHEGSYKQQDPAPRYHAGNAAMVLANIYAAKTLLGTATPAIETYYNATIGRYGLIRLNHRHEDIELPQITVINTKELRRTKQMKSVLSPPLKEKIGEALAKNEQIILFQNRRGFSSLISCTTCSWTQHCQHCDVSLTYHKQQRMMVCHYCGATYPVPALCPDCKTATLDTLGYGTERVEEETSEAFPEASIARMDLDTTRGKRSYERIISDFECGKTNILIGTQMISKGLDFNNVSIVGILNADNILNFPDFRAHEKAFQLMTQVSGRAGRKNKQGEVILQTSHPGNPIITHVKSNDYESLFNLQTNERKLFRYPPFYRLIEITLRGKNEQVVDDASRLLGNALHQSFGDRVLGPSKPPIARIQSLHIRKILLKIENNTPIQQVRNVLRHHQSMMASIDQYRSILVHYDVDPL